MEFYFIWLMLKPFVVVDMERNMQVKYRNGRETKKKSFEHSFNAVRTSSDRIGIKEIS